MGLINKKIQAPESRTIFSAFIVLLCMGFTFWQLKPELLFMNSTTAGGDMGAHVWGPDFLKHHLLPHGRISGWTPDWYGGFPALTFYFPLPALLTVVLSYIFPYAVAFKLVTVSGIVTLPLSAYLFGKFARLPFPAPLCLAAAVVPFLFDTGYTILGGNIASTLAGEFAFSIGLSFSLVFLGLVAGGLETGKRRAAASLLFTAVILSHILPSLFALVGGCLLVLIKLLTGPRRLNAFRWALPVGIFGSCMTAFWLIPFVARSQYMNDMGWEKIGTGVQSGIKLYDQTIVDYTDALFPSDLMWLLFFAFLGAGVALFLQRRIGIFLVLVAVIFAVGFCYAPQGRLWNARLLPFWYLSLYMLAGLLISEIGLALADAFKRLEGGAGELIARVLSYVAPVVAVTLSLSIAGHTLPPPTGWPAAWNGVWHDPAKSGGSFIPGWATWNYTGYDGKKDGQYAKPAYPEYKALVDTMYDVGKQHGCGRAMWEYEPTLDRFGTPMALMLMPMWTHGCIGSMEGLFFESSATVPYHFLNQALLSKTPSSAMRDLPYGTLDVADGVTRLQMLGAKYYMVVSPQAQEQAAVDPRLTLVSTVPAAAGADGEVRTWNIYEVAGAELVAPLSNLPAVMTDPGSVEAIVHTKAESDKKSAQISWLENGVKWYQEPGFYDVPLAASGPSNWPRVANADSIPERVPTEPVNVKLITTSDDRISFTVDKPGVPVVVRTSYFPNWKASGAKGPYRITPNLMVVIPTKTEVSLHYGRTPIDWLGLFVTGVGIAGTIWMWRRDRQNLSPNTPASNAESAESTEPGQSQQLPGNTEPEPVADQVPSGD